jgi:mannose/fructose/N-acetylgalactosamine-specific phosphotransferase system component IIC
LVSYLRVPTLFLAIIALFLAITDFYRDQEMMEQQTGPVVETDAQEDFLNG